MVQKTAQYAKREKSTVFLIPIASSVSLENLAKLQARPLKLAAPVPPVGFAGEKIPYFQRQGGGSQVA